MDKMFVTFNSEIKGIDEHEGTLTAYVSTGSRDRMDEVLDPDGADMKNFKANPVVLFAHKYDEPPIGKALWIKKDGEGVIAKVKFATTEFAQEIFKLFKEGFMKAFSVGFIPKEWEDGDGIKKARRTFKKWELLEFSAVPVPANPEALALAIQRGLQVSDTLKKALNIENPEINISVSGANSETVTISNEENVKKIELNDSKNYMEEISNLQSEMSQLKEKEQDHLSKIASLQDAVSDMRYKFYTLISKLERPHTEISGEDVAKMISDAVIREISKARGRV